MLVFKPLLVAKVGVYGWGNVGAMQHCTSQLIAYRAVLGASVQRRIQVGEATASRADFNASGNFLPLFSARRSIPAHVLELKKNLCGIKVVSSTCDNEHTAASLGHSEILGVKDSPRNCSFGSINKTSVSPSAPWRDERIIFTGKRAQKAPKGVVFGVEDSGDVFPEDNAWDSSN